MNTKKCRACGKDVNINDSFCTNCGNSDFIYNNLSNSIPTNVNNTVNNVPNNSFNSMPNNMYYNQNNQPVKNNNGIIIAIIIIVIIVLITTALVIGIFVSTFKNSSNKNGDSNITSTYEAIDDDLEETEEPKITKEPEETIAPTETVEPTKAATKFDKGSVTNNVYKNEWLNIKLPIPTGYSSSNANNNASNIINSSGMDTGLYVQNSLGESIIVCFMDISKYGSYMQPDTINKSVLDGTKNMYKSSSYKVINETEYKKITIGGREYLSYIVTVEYLSTKQIITQSIYINTDDTKCSQIILSSAGNSTAKNNKIIKSIQKCK